MSRYPCIDGGRHRWIKATTGGSHILCERCGDRMRGRVPVRLLACGLLVAVGAGCSMPVVGLAWRSTIIVQGRAQSAEGHNATEGGATVGVPSGVVSNAASAAVKAVVP